MQLLRATLCSSIMNCTHTDFSRWRFKQEAKKYARLWFLKFSTKIENFFTCLLFTLLILQVKHMKFDFYKISSSQSKFQNLKDRASAVTKQSSSVG
jgi:hypothetical protein